MRRDTILGLLVAGLMFLALAGCVAANKKPPLSAEAVIRGLGLVPMSDAACPGFYQLIYQSAIRADMEKDRPAASLIYYLMPREVTIDPWHILTSDEVLLYHAGAPMIQLLLYADGRWEEVVLGPEFDQGQVAQQVIPAGTWMGFARKADSLYDWGLYGVMVAPGWHSEDIRMVRTADELAALKRKFPAAVARGVELGLF
ncbi:MAG: cupin domain-containing protein [Deltaproteobacteria bacterium]|nr:cupin domain-containing protein [Deltaproteobacteria bacterium]